MITLTVTLVCLVIYLGVGLHLARLNLLRSWERARTEWSIPSNIQSEVRAGFITMLLFWPVRLPARSLSRLLDHEVTAGDPHEKDRIIRERERRIAELERELGIGQR